ncbi:MAG TPA: M36 family metallopeptidase [Solirubrobacterales bacterium]|nr:M36 family metallopeptidase [Solirubrobacterales bacterium]
MTSRARLVAAASAAAVIWMGASPNQPASGAAGAETGTQKLAAPGVELVRADMRVAPRGGLIERYRQHIGGLPVLGGEAVVATPAAGAPIVVSDDTVKGLERAAPPRLSRPAAIARARVAAGAQQLRAAPTARLGIEPGSGRAAWEVVLAAAKPVADLIVTVDARSGDVLRERDLLKRATGTARVFDPNPVTTLASYRGLRDNKDRDSGNLNGVLVPVTLERLTGARGCLTGQYVVAVLGKGKAAEGVCAPGADFAGVTRARNPFEAVMAYFHIDRTRAYIDSLALSEGLRRKPQRVEVNSFTDDNSFFSPATRRMALGTGGVDDGEDADVIVHEYGHSVQDQAVHFFGETIQGAAMGEGFADYLAAVMSSQATGGNSTFDPCMFEWDATSYTKNRCARRADKQITFRQAQKRCFGDPHCTGEAWSGALWELRGLLATDEAGRSVMDRVVLESHFLLTRKADLRDGARALVAADKLLYAGAHAAAIEAEMVQRGFCKPRGC